MARDRKLLRPRDLAIIAAVILILSPVLACTMHRMRMLSEQQTCSDNLKRLGVACEMYQADWDDVLVPYGAPFAWGYAGDHWPELLDVYINRIPGGQMSGANLPPEYQCPSRLDTVAWAYERTYGMNTYCGGWDPGGTPRTKFVRDVRYPNATIRIAESCFPQAGGSLIAPLPSHYNDANPMGHHFPEWHNGKGNVLWIDGHVSAMTRAQYNTGGSDNTWFDLARPKPQLPN